MAKVTGGVWHMYGMAVLGATTSGPLTARAADMSSFQYLIFELQYVKCQLAVGSA
jgi:hypothetical protein